MPADFFLSLKLKIKYNGINVLKKKLYENEMLLI